MREPVVTWRKVHGLRGRTTPVLLSGQAASENDRLLDNRANARSNCLCANTATIGESKRTINMPLLEPRSQAFPWIITIQQASFLEKKDVINDNEKAWTPIKIFTTTHGST